MMTTARHPFSDLVVGVVGTGFMGVAHTEALRRLGIGVKGIVGSTPDRAREKATAANLPTVYDSLDALLADDDIDVVHITTPNSLHHAQVSAVLEWQGVHRQRLVSMGPDVQGWRRLRERGVWAGIVRARSRLRQPGERRRRDRRRLRRRHLHSV